MLSGVQNEILAHKTKHSIRSDGIISLVEKFRDSVAFRLLHVLLYFERVKKGFI